MGMNLNKTLFIKQLEKETNRSEEECILINSIFEQHFLVGKKNKEKMVCDLKEKLEVTEIEAEKIYSIGRHILSIALKEKMKHPFGSNHKIKE